MYVHRVIRAADSADSHVQTRTETGKLPKPAGRNTSAPGSLPWARRTGGIRSAPGAGSAVAGSRRGGMGAFGAVDATFGSVPGAPAAAT